MTRFAYPRRDRLAGAALALAVQAGLVVLLIFSHAPTVTPEKAARELIFVLPRLLKPAPPLPRRAVEQARPRSIAPAPPLPMPAPLSSPAVPAPAAPPEQDLRNLGQSIFGCAPENYSSLTPQQRALCPRPGEGMAIQSAPDLMHPSNSHVKDEAHWQEEWQREKNGLIIPCAGIMATKDGPVPSVNPLCVLAMLATGHGDELVDPHKWPHYQIQQLSSADFRKIEQAYDAWHKAHRGSPVSAAAPQEKPP